MNESHEVDGDRGAVREELRWHSRFVDVAGDLNDSEGYDSEEPNDHGHEDVPGAPRELGTSPSEGEEDCSDSTDEYEVT